jgi:hypothetical protein
VDLDIDREGGQIHSVDFLEHRHAKRRSTMNFSVPDGASIRQAALPT